MKVVVGIFVIGLFLINPHLAYANSYLEMITTAPEPQVETESSVVSVQTKSAEPSNLWYDSRIKTSSPVVMSSYPKYYAWARFKAYGDEDDTHEKIQNLIYTVEGGLLGWGIYEIYKY